MEGRGYSSLYNPRQPSSQNTVFPTLLLPLFQLLAAADSARERTLRCLVYPSGRVPLLLRLIFSATPHFRNVIPHVIV